MNDPITITEVVGRAVQGMTKPFLCKAGFFDYYVKRAYAGKNSLCCEWGGNIDPSPPVGYAGTRHRSPNIRRRLMAMPRRVERRSEELARSGNKERRYPIASTMMDPWGRGLPRIIGFPWTSADGFLRSLVGCPVGAEERDKCRPRAREGG